MNRIAQSRQCGRLKIICLGPWNDARAFLIARPSFPDVTRVFHGDCNEKFQNWHVRGFIVIDDLFPGPQRSRSPERWPPDSQKLYFPNNQIVDFRTGTLSKLLTEWKGVAMEHSHGTTCGKLLLDIIYYERSCGRLSPEMEYLFEQHLTKCPSCRHRFLGFKRMLREATMVRNYG